jgi:hypothetical protein
MTTFYRDSAVYVGSAELHVEDQAYRLDDLELVWHRHGKRGVQQVAIIAARIALVVVVLGAIAIAAVLLQAFDIGKHDTVVVLGGVVLAVVFCAGAGMFIVEGVITMIERSYETGGVEHQIWARHLDEDLLLFATRDKLRFGKVYRALQRAIEHRDIYR